MSRTLQLTVSAWTPVCKACCVSPMICLESVYSHLQRMDCFTCTTAMCWRKTPAMTQRLKRQSSFWMLLWVITVLPSVGTESGCVPVCVTVVLVGWGGVRNGGTTGKIKLPWQCDLLTSMTTVQRLFLFTHLVVVLVHFGSYWCNHKWLWMFDIIGLLLGGSDE